MMSHGKKSKPKIKRSLAGNQRQKKNGEEILYALEGIVEFVAPCSMQM
jgi:hypothetical protein